MDPGAIDRMNLGTALTLGRVSNLPTVWSNVLAGMVLGGGDAVVPTFLGLAVAASLLYLSGMFLNDAFDTDWDAEHRPERPIPRGDASRGEVFLCGGFMTVLALGLLLTQGLRPFSFGLALSAAIVTYDWRHKTLGLSPWLMGLCRMLVYLLAAGAFVITSQVIAAGMALLAYVAAITYTARSEHLGKISRTWPLILLFAPAALALIRAADAPLALMLALGLAGWTLLQLRRLFGADRAVGRAVAGLIAGISLVDAAFIAAAGTPGLALWAVAAWACTLALQLRWAGT